MTDAREFKRGSRVEDAERHTGIVQRIYPTQGQVYVRWHGGYATTELMDKLRIIEEA